MSKIKIIVIATVLVVFAIASVIGSVWYADKREAYEQFADDINHLSGVELGSSRDEVLYALGNPRYVQNHGEVKKSIIEPLEDGMDDYPEFLADMQKLDPDYLGVDAISDNHDIWSHMVTYPSSDGDWYSLLRIEFESDKVVGIRCAMHCSTGIIRTPSYYYTSGGRLYGFSEEMIKDRLGPNYVEEYQNRKDGKRMKLLRYDDLGLYFTLQQGELTGIERYGPVPDFWTWLNNYQGY